jgi:DNA-binding XRE family transcriptional regulator
MDREFIPGGPLVSGFSPDLIDNNHQTNDDDDDDVSSLTGGIHDQDIVEELHHALQELRAELEESRAEAARAVKVAEQAIQSAEANASKDWNSTVTHKAAAAAAMAQKRSAEAMAKQRMAEERLQSERKNVAFWKKQAELAEEEAGCLLTRAAAAEGQYALLKQELEAERTQMAEMMERVKERFASAQLHQALESAMERNRSLEIELSGMRQNEQAKADEMGQSYVQL